MFTRQHYEAAASIVRAIVNGEWTNELPDWAQSGDETHHYFVSDIERANLTAEAFLILFQAFPNPRFDRERFLIACGLVAPKVKARKAKVNAQNL